jgi:hypothetical protein
MQEINREEKTRGLVAESKIGGHGVESKATWLLLLLGLFEAIGRIWATLYICVMLLRCRLNTSGIPEGILESRVLFSFTSFCRIFQDSPSHRIFRRMYEALNIDKK